MLKIENKYIAQCQIAGFQYVHLHSITINVKKGLEKNEISIHSNQHAQVTNKVNYNQINNKCYPCYMHTFISRHVCSYQQLLCTHVSQLDLVVHFLQCTSVTH